MPSTETKVLVIDDDPDLRRALTLVLKIEGFAPETACDGVEALEALERDMPDVILLDMMMPGMNGWEFARLAHERFGASLAPVLLLTAGGNAAKWAAEIGVQGWLSKPFAVDDLLHEVRRLGQTRKRS